MTKNELIALLMQEANHEVGNQNCRFSNEVQRSLYDLITSSVMSMPMEVLRSQVQISKAKQNVHSFCRQMCYYAKNNNQTIVDASSFSVVRMSVCHHWPFC